ncbi:MAG: anti-sigma F factor [Clostridia bacterium]|nr:anti-sigma F factor [Clostridia bacterium]
MENNNEINLTFNSLSENEALARNVISCYVLPLNPTVSEITDIKTAVSEAVTNAIVHAYKDKIGKVEMSASVDGNTLHIKIKDEGVGIEDVEKALEPFFTTSDGDERSGMGFTIIQSFMDGFKVESVLGKGTSIYMSKVIGSK